MCPSSCSSRWSRLFELRSLLGAAVLTRTLTRIGKTRPKVWKLSFRFTFFSSNIYTHNSFWRCRMLLHKYHASPRTSLYVRAFCNGGFLSKEIIITRRRERYYLPFHFISNIFAIICLLH